MTPEALAYALAGAVSVICLLIFAMVILLARYDRYLADLDQIARIPCTLPTPTPLTPPAPMPNIAPTALRQAGTCQAPPKAAPMAYRPVRTCAQMGACQMRRTSCDLPSCNLD